MEEDPPRILPKEASSKCQFHYLSHNGLTEDEREELFTRLFEDFDYIRYKFAGLVFQTLKSLKNSSKTPDDLIKTYFPNMEHFKTATTFDDIFDQNYCSFLDYEFLASIIKSYCTELYEKLTDYVITLNAYCHRKVSEVPTAFTSVSGKRFIRVKLGSEFNSLTMKEVKIFQTHLSSITKMELRLLEFESDFGSIVVVFTSLNEDDLHPLSEKQKSELFQLSTSVLKLYSDNPVYFDREEYIRDLSQETQLESTSTTFYNPSHKKALSINELDMTTSAIPGASSLNAVSHISPSLPTTSSLQQNPVCSLANINDVYNQVFQDSMKKFSFLPPVHFKETLCNILSGISFTTGANSSTQEQLSSYASLTLVSKAAGKYDSVQDKLSYELESLQERIHHRDSSATVCNSDALVPNLDIAQASTDLCAFLKPFKADASDTITAKKVSDKCLKIIPTAVVNKQRPSSEASASICIGCSFVTHCSWCNQECCEHYPLKICSYPRTGVVSSALCFECISYNQHEDAKEWAQASLNFLTQPNAETIIASLECALVAIALGFDHRKLLKDIAKQLHTQGINSVAYNILNLVMSISKEVEPKLYILASSILQDLAKEEKMTSKERYTLALASKEALDVAFKALHRNATLTDSDVRKMACVPNTLFTEEDAFFLKRLIQRLSDMNSPYLAMSTPLCPRDEDGWLIQAPELGVPVEYSKLVGFAFDADKDEPSLELLVVKTDPKTGKKGLFSKEDINVMLQLDLDDEALFFSLDPPSEYLDKSFHPFQQWRHHEKISGSEVLNTMFITDYLMKSFATDTDISSEPPFKQRPYKDGLTKNLSPLLKEAIRSIKERLSNGSQPNRRRSRFWLESTRVKYSKSQKGSRYVYYLGDVDIEVKSESSPLGIDLTLKQDNSPESPHMSFARDMTNHYSELSEYFPVFARLQELSKLQFFSFELQSLVEIVKAKYPEKAASFTCFIQAFKQPQSLPSSTYIWVPAVTSPQLRSIFYGGVKLVYESDAAPLFLEGNNNQNLYMSECDGDEGQFYTKAVNIVKRVALQELDSISMPASCEVMHCSDIKPPGLLLLGAECIFKFECPTTVSVQIKPQDLSEKEIDSYYVYSPPSGKASEHLDKTFHHYEHSEKINGTEVLNTMFITDYLIKSFIVSKDISAEPPFKQRLCKDGLTKNLPPVLQEATEHFVSSHKEVFSVINDGMETGDWDKVKYILEDLTLLISTNTRGQAEFLDLHASLVQGPSFNVLFSRLVDELDSLFEMYYTNEDGMSTEKENSTMIVDEVLLQALSSIACFSGTFCDDDDTPSGEASNMQLKKPRHSKSKVMFVGTHADQEEFDKLLQEKIKGTEFFDKDIIKFASEDQLMLSVDNMNGGEDEMDSILDKVIEKNFETMTIPVSWLLFNLYMKSCTRNLCEKLAKKVGIRPSELQEVLWFLHHRVGILDMFDSATNLIRRTFTFDKVVLRAMSDTLLPPKNLVKLLEYLGILTALPPTSTTANIHGGMTYFMPCVLKSARASELSVPSSSDSDPAPLILRYDCGYVPVGVFPSMITNLVSQQQGVWEMIEEGLYKNRVQFQVGGDCDTVTLISHPQYFEVAVSRNASYRTPTELLCAHIRSVIQSTLNTVTSRMNYHFRMGYKFGFECPTHPGREHLCVLADTSAWNMKCLQNPKKKQPVCLDNHPNMKVWFSQEQFLDHQHPISLTAMCCYPKGDASTHVQHIADTQTTSPALNLPSGISAQTGGDDILSLDLEKVDGLIFDRDDDLGDVLEAVNTLAAVWDKFALKLHLKYDHIKVIKKDNPGDSEACLTEAMSEWLKENYNTARFGVPSWRTLVKAVQAMDMALAHKIADKHRGSC